MARNAAQPQWPRWLKLVSLSLVVIVGLGAAAIIVPPMVLEPSVDVALIKADDTPYKIKPQDPGGIDIPHTETTVMGMIDDFRQPEDATEVMRPPSAVPEMPPTPVDDTGNVAMAPEPQPAAPATKTDSAGDATADNTAAASESETAPVSVEGEPDNSASSNDDTGQNTSGMTAMPQSKPAPPKRVVVEGDEPLYVVQLAAFRKPETAREQAGLLAGKHKGRLDGAELGTMKTDTGDDGIFWRVVTEPMARADADNVCTALKRAGQDCILRKYSLAKSMTADSKGEG